MQDGFVADVGDFGKYGLLRALCNLQGSSHDARLRLGVVWCAVKGDGIGRLTQYSDYRQCDPDLYDKLRDIIHGQRRMKSIEKSGILGNETMFFDEPLNHKTIRADSRWQDRVRWLERACAATEGCQVVFFDPDNGLNPVSVEKHHAVAPSYVFVDEIVPFLNRRQSVILYHHTGRRGPVQDQILRTLTKLEELTPPRARAFALRYRAGNSRAYFVIPSQEHHRLLSSRAEQMVLGKWHGPFEPVVYSS